MNLELTPKTDKFAYHALDEFGDEDDYSAYKKAVAFARKLEKDLNKALNALKMINALKNNDFPPGDFSEKAVKAFNYGYDVMVELENKLK